MSDFPAFKLKNCVDGTNCPFHGTIWTLTPDFTREPFTFEIIISNCISQFQIANKRGVLPYCIISQISLKRYNNSY